MQGDAGAVAMRRIWLGKSVHITWKTTPLRYGLLNAPFFALGNMVASVLIALIGRLIPERPHVPGWAAGRSLSAANTVVPFLGAKS